MTEHRPTPPLIRRVPGASGSGPGKPARTVLPDALLRRMLAAVEAARAVEEDAAERVEDAGPAVVADPSALIGSRPGVDRLVGVHVLDVALRHVPQRVVPPGARLRGDRLGGGDLPG